MKLVTDETAETAEGAEKAEIRIDNARSHNLTGVSCGIPVESLTVVTGVSGSGKSTLAFDTLYAEGQRRYVTSLSTYARQFLERMPRPEVDAISNLPPTIAIEQGRRVQDARSTVGTASEIVDLLRLLYAKVGVTRCRDCDRLAQPGHVADVAARIAERYAGKRLVIAAPLVALAKETFRKRRDRLVQAGHGRIVDAEGEIVDISEITLTRLKALWRDALLLVDRLAVKGEAPDSRLLEAVANGFREGSGEIVVFEPGAARESYRQAFSCDGCGRVFVEPTPALFSFNSPLGACENCNGFGRTAEIDWRRVVPDESASIAEGAIAPFTTPSGRGMQRDLLEACDALEVDVDRPFAEYDEQVRALVFEGDDDVGWYGVRGWFDWLERRRYRVQARTTIARYRRFDPCLECEGTRLCEAARSVDVGGIDLGSVTRMSLAALDAWLRDIAWSERERALASRVLDLLSTRLATCLTVGLGYITLDRQLRTLSGGEAQRIQLASALGGRLSRVLYVLDEPSVGLHARDMARLLEVLRRVRDQGNTVVVVEHAREIIAAADHLIDLGPGAGRHGGRVVAEGPVDEIRASARSHTGQALRNVAAALRKQPRDGFARAAIEVRDAREHNLAGFDVSIPLGGLVAVTGVSGAGKSTLVHDIVVAHLARQPLEAEGVTGDDPGACAGVDAGDALDRVVVVGQRPASRSARSNAATVSKAFDGIRKVFAGTREAKALGIAPGWFSFNVAGGRCEDCEGSGFVVIDMQFLDDVRVACDSCGGRRYRSEVLGVRYQGRSIADVLELSIEEATEVFGDHPRIVAALEPLVRVGLGYLGLGQPLSTLSGGEHQRMRLGLALREGAERTLYVLDEPTTGLHPRDVEVLLSCLEDLVAAGGSLLVVEHNLDVVACADHVIDLGPEGGPGGGEIVALGTPATVAATPASITGEALRIFMP
ncbi:MAG: excinuclease ABC subunit UvrA [Myxococcota bacterium]|nr:excinuclease ABC subunit UvrA [Myxococcota bacterium]